MSLAVSKEEQAQHSKYAGKPKPKYVFFMSNRCKSCKKLYDLIAQQVELYNLVNFIEIEKQRSLPPEVTSVPAIYDGKKVHIGNQALKWFQDASLEHLDSCFVGGNNKLLGDRFSFLGPREELFSNWSTLESINGTSVKEGNGGNSSNQPASSTHEQPKQNVTSSMEQLIEQRRQDLK